MGSNDGPSTKTNFFMEDGSNVYLESASIHVHSIMCSWSTWVLYFIRLLTKSGCEYEKYNGGDGFLGDNFETKIIRHGRVKLL